MKGLVRLLTLTWLFGTSIAQNPTPSASFAFPVTPKGNAPMLVVNLVDTLVVQWTSNFQPAWLFLFCDTGRLMLLGNTSMGTDNTIKYVPEDIVDMTQDWSKGYQCHFDLNYEPKYFKGINGPRFSISSFAREAKTFASSSTAAFSSATTTPFRAATPLTTAATPAVTTNSADITETPSPTAGASAAGNPDGADNSENSDTNSNAASANSTSSNKSGISAGATAGIVVGVVSGVAAFLAVCLLVSRRRRAQDVQHGEIYIKPHGVEIAQPYQDKYTSSPPYPGPIKQTYASEVPSDPAPQELAGSETQQPKA